MNEGTIGAEILLRIISNYVLRLKCRFPLPSKRGMAAAAHTAPHIYLPPEDSWPCDSRPSTHAYRAKSETMNVLAHETPEENHT
jgi:hypothetical protein